MSYEENQNIFVPEQYNQRSLPLIALPRLISLNPLLPFPHFVLGWKKDSLPWTR